MAQYFDNMDYPLGPAPPNLIVFGSTTATIVEDVDALNGRALELTRETGVGARGVDLDGWSMLAPAGDNEVYIRFKRAEREIEIKASKISVDRRYQVNQESVDYNRASTTRGSYNHGLDFSEYINLRCVINPSQGTIRAKTWSGNPASEPSEWSIDTTAFAGESVQEGAILRIDLTAASSGAKGYIDAVGLGTDGDPAPTGPVDDQPRRRASPLLWTPF